MNFPRSAYRGSDVWNNHFPPTTTTTTTFFHSMLRCLLNLFKIVIRLYCGHLLVRLCTPASIKQYLHRRTMMNNGRHKPTSLDFVVNKIPRWKATNTNCPLRATCSCACPLQACASQACHLGLAQNYRETRNRVLRIRRWLLWFRTKSTKVACGWKDSSNKEDLNKCPLVRQMPKLAQGGRRAKYGPL